MSWVTIDQEKCNGCGICAARCMRCFSEKEGKMTAHADALCCNVCGHCVALCPTDAISHSLMTMDNFVPIETPVNFDPDAFIQFVRQRRSYRSFKDRPVDRRDLEKLVEMCRYIPTGSNLQTVQIQVVTNREKIAQLSDLTVTYFMDMIGQVEAQVKQFQAENKPLPKELLEMSDFAGRYKMLGLAKQFGIDPILHMAPAVMIFHSPPSPSTPKDDCVIAAQTVVLAAMTMGLGTCYIGLLVFAANSAPAVQQALALPPGNKVHSVVIMGYPKLKFRKTVDRKPAQATWVE